MTEQDADIYTLYELYGTPLCYECGQRGHTHFTCPGVQLEVPKPEPRYTWDGLGSVHRKGVK